MTKEERWKEARRRASKKWRERNKERVRESHKKWCEKNREKKNAISRRSYANNKEQRLEDKKEYYEKNKEEIVAKNTKYYFDTKGDFRYYLTRVWMSQRHVSEKRGHQPPAYTKQELGEWIKSQPNFQELFDKYIESGFDSWLKPSVDRLDDNKGYSFDNIQLITWKENHDKGIQSKKKK